MTKAELKAHPAIQAATARGGSYKTVPVAVLPSSDPIQGSLEIINHLEAIGAATTPRSAGADESIAWAYVLASKGRRRVSCAHSCRHARHSGMTSL